MDLSEIPTPETDAAWSDPQRTRDGTGFRSNVPSIDIALSVVEKSKDLERRLTVAREALKEIHKNPAWQDNEVGFMSGHIAWGALLQTAPKP